MTAARALVGALVVLSGAGVHAQEQRSQFAYREFRAQGLFHMPEIRQRVNAGLQLLRRTGITRHLSRRVGLLQRTGRRDRRHTRMLATEPVRQYVEGADSADVLLWMSEHLTQLVESTRVQVASTGLEPVARRSFVPIEAPLDILPDILGYLELPGEEAEFAGFAYAVTLTHVISYEPPRSEAQSLVAHRALGGAALGPQEGHAAILTGPIRTVRDIAAASRGEERVWFSHARGEYFLDAPVGAGSYDTVGLDFRWQSEALVELQPWVGQRPLLNTAARRP